VDLEFGLELVDPGLRCGELVTLDRSQARDQSAVDGLLAPPGVDRLAADPEVTGKIRDLATRREQVENASPELVSPIFETPQTRSAKLPRLTSPGRAAQA
jgi:hypothetical protein